MRVLIERTLIARIETNTLLEKLRASESREPLIERLTAAIEGVAECLDEILAVAAAKHPEVGMVGKKRH